ncbi:MAG TPA: hypothetical protein VJV79_19225 [Polyangiaceae bacterium]|nr:hypothetical protein [Polyangiaceae bacterium]
MSEILLVASSLILNALLPYLIVRRDLRGLSGERLARAWTHASFLSAVIAFGPLALPVHFGKTRRSLTGFGLGVGLSVLSLAAQALVVALLSTAFGLE